MFHDITRHSDKLFVFYQVALHGSLHAAGRVLHMSVPSLSYAINELEMTLKVPLFTRSSKGMGLTIEGQKLKIFCSRYFEELTSLCDQIQDPSLRVQRRIKIGIFPSIAIYFWPIVYENLTKELDFLVSLQTNRSSILLENLVQKEIDIAITVDSLRDPQIERNLLYEDTYSFFISKEKNLESKIIKDQVLFYMPEARDSEGRTLKQHLASWKIKFRNEFEMDSLEVTKEFIRRGFGVGILPNKVAQTMKSEIKECPPSMKLPAGFGSHSFYLSYRKDLDLPQRMIEELTQAVKKAVKKMN